MPYITIYIYIYIIYKDDDIFAPEPSIIAVDIAPLELDLIKSGFVIK